MKFEAKNGESRMITQDDVDEARAAARAAEFEDVAGRIEDLAREAKAELDRRERNAEPKPPALRRLEGDDAPAEPDVAVEQLARRYVMGERLLAQERELERSIRDSEKQIAQAKERLAGLRTGITAAQESLAFGAHLVGIAGFDDAVKSNVRGLRDAIERARKEPPRQ